MRWHSARRRYYPANTDTTTQQHYLQHLNVLFWTFMCSVTFTIYTEPYTKLVIIAAYMEAKIVILQYIHHNVS